MSKNIHDNYINLEVWGVHPDYDISEVGSSFNEIPEESFIGNVELELNLESAKALVQELSSFIKPIEKD